MNLSKIPEQSENDFVTADYLSRSYAASYLGVPDEEFRRMIRVIARLLRHGMVLAKNIDIEMVDSEQIGKVMVAIEFFEQFGGNDDR